MQKNPFKKSDSGVKKIDSGVMRVARGGSGAKAPLLAARPIKCGISLSISCR